MLLLNLLLALCWLLLTGQFTPVNFLFGFVVAYGLLWLFGRLAPSESASVQAPGYFGKMFQVIGFGLFFVWELILANVRVAMDVLRWRPQMEPAVVAVPLQGFSDAEVTVLANFITLTPGTLSLDVVDNVVDGAAQEGRILYVHAMHGGRTQAAIDRFRTQLQQQIARRVQEVMG